MVSPPHREPQPSQTSEVTAGEPVFGDYDEEDQAFDWLVDQKPGHRHDGQGHGTEESCLSADSCEEHQDDEHDGGREQDDVDEHRMEHLSARPRIGHRCLCSRAGWWRRAESWPRAWALLGWLHAAVS